MLAIQTGTGNLTSDAQATNGTTVTLAKPANIANGDLLVAIVTFQNANGTPAITPPSGWTQVSPAVGLSPLRPSGIYILPVPTASSISATNWTWTTNTSTGRRRGMLFRVTGADLTTQPEVTGSWFTSGSSSSSIDLAGVTTTHTNTMLLAMVYTQMAAGGGYPGFTPPSNMTSIATINTTPDANANTALWAGFEPLTSPIATGTRTVGISPTVASSGGCMIALRSLDSANVPAIVHNIVGAVTDTSFQIAYKVANVTTGVRAVVSTAADLSNPTYSSQSVPDSAGYGHITISGRNPDTKYYWGLEIDGNLSANFHGVTRTYPTVGTQTSFAFIASSCINTGDNPTTLDFMRTRTDTNGLPARFFSHLGDFHYVYATSGGNPIAPEDQAVLRENYASQIALSRQHQMYREVPLSYTWSDIDSFGSNCDGTYAANDEANAAYRQVFPIPSDMPSTSGVYRTWVLGRIRFIQSDMRTFASLKTATDNSSKTKLGATQKAWFLNIINTASEPVIIWLGDSAWFGAALTGGSNEAWHAYNTERTEIGNAIAAAGVNLIYIHGDTHTLAADDGTNNQWGGFPFAGASPISRPDMNPWPTTSGWVPLSNGSYPSSSQAGKAYGWFEITDTGNQIILDYSGFHDEIERISMTITWNVGLWQRGDGTKLIPYVKINNSLVELQ